MSSFVFLVLGFLSQNKYEIEVNRKSIFKVVILATLLVWMIYRVEFAIDVRQNICTDWFLYIIIAVCGIYITLYVAKVISCYLKKTKEILAYVGKNTMIILFLHPLTFKLIGLFQIYVLGIPYDKDFQQWGNVRTTGMWAYLYCVLGCTIPLLVKHMWCCGIYNIRFGRKK